MHAGADRDAGTRGATLIGTAGKASVEQGKAWPSCISDRLSVVFRAADPAYCSVGCNRCYGRLPNAKLTAAPCTSNPRPRLCLTWSRYFSHTLSYPCSHTCLCSCVRAHCVCFGCCIGCCGCSIEPLGRTRRCCSLTRSNPWSLTRSDLWYLTCPNPWSCSSTRR